MANPSVTYTFTNSTTADGTQVSQNFTDLINAMTDGTKSFSIDALTVAGAALFNGATTLGNATGDTITIGGYISGSIIGNTTAGVPHAGRTDGSAPASGMIGYSETTSRARSAKSAATTVTSLNIGSPTSLTLKAGRTYKIFGYGGFLPVNTTTVQELDVAVSKTSATLPGVDTMGVPTAGEIWVTDGRPFTSIGNDIILPFGPYIYTVPAGGDVSIYLVGRAAFGVSTLGIFGSMTAEIIA